MTTSDRCRVAIAFVAAGWIVPTLQAEACKGSERELAAAVAALARGDAAAAERGFSAVRTDHPDCPEALLGLAEMLLQTGKPAEADALSARALSADPANVQALMLRGRILGMKGEFAKAEELLSKACKLNASNPQAHFELGVLYDGMQRNAKAVEQFEMVAKLNPENARAYDYLALNLEPLGQFERAELAYKQALRVNHPPLFDGFLDYNYGRFLMKRNRLQEAAAHLDRAAELAPNTRAIHYERAKLDENLGKYGDARAEAERALALADPGGVILDLQVYYQLVRIYTRLGETELAAKYTKLAEASNVPLRSRMRRGR